MTGMASVPNTRSQRRPVSGGSLLSLRAASLLGMLARQSPAFWAVSVYLFFEYVRPQTVYPALDVLPLAKISIILGTLLVLAEGRMRFAAQSLWLGLVVFAGVLLASSFAAVYPQASWDAMPVWINWLMLIFVVGAGIRTHTELLLLLLQWVLWNLKMSQHGARAWVGNGFSFDAWGVSGAPGWFQNSGEFGIEMCVFLPIACALTYGAWTNLTKWRRVIALGIIFSVLASVIATSSRGAFLGVAVIAVWIALRSQYRMRIGLAALTFVSVLWLLLPEGNKARWRSAGSDKDSVARLTYWKHGIEITNAYPLLGIGYNNWLTYYRSKYNPKGEVPHNYLVEAGSQMGYSGLVAFAIMTGLYFRANSRSRKLTGRHSANPDRMLWSLSHGLDGAMIGFLSSGFFVTVLFYPYYWMNLALALALSRVIEGRSNPKRNGIRKHVNQTQHALV